TERRGPTSMVSRERPRILSPGTPPKDEQAEGDDDDGVPDLLEEVRPRDEYEGESGDREDDGNGIKPHPEWPRRFGVLRPQNQETNGLHQKLHDDADDDQRGNHVREFEEAEDQRHTTQGQ